MSVLAVERPLPHLRDLGFADRACGVCGWRFFTTMGLYEHEQTHRPPEPPRYRLSPEGRASLQSIGSAAGKRLTSTRRRCNACGMETHVPGMGKHQKASGHTGWTSVA